MVNRKAWSTKQNFSTHCHLERLLDGRPPSRAELVPIEGDGFEPRLSLQRLGEDQGRRLIHLVERQVHLLERHQSAQGGCDGLAPLGQRAVRQDERLEAGPPAWSNAAKSVTLAGSGSAGTACR